MRIAHIKIALFALFLLAPVLSLACFGSVESYGQAAHPQFPRIDQVLRGKKGKLDQFGDALLHRSPAMKLAAKMRNWISYRLVGFVDTEGVVSGVGDWLFYRHEFGGGRCLDEAAAATDLRELGALTDMGRAAGIDMIVSMSPDKSIIYPEFLSRFARGYWKCSVQNAATLRRLIRQHAPLLLDHAELILAEKARHPDVPLYFATDSHWTPYGGALALRQLLEAASRDVVFPPPRSSGQTTLLVADLGRMLILPVQEQAADVDREWLKELGALNRDPGGYRTVIINDSFYNRIRPQLTAAFPNLRMLDFLSGDESLAAGVMAADRLIINSVERSLLQRIEDRGLRSGAPIPVAIVKRNTERAKDCGGFIPARAVAVPADLPMEGTAAGSEASAIAVEIPRGSPTHLPCLRLSLNVHAAGVLTVALPDWNDGTFEPGHAIRYQITPGQPVVGFVLPEYAAGASIRLDLGADSQGVEIGAIETGEIDRPRLLSAAP